MAYIYDKNKWELYDPLRPIEEQVHSVITKRKLDHMEEGIAQANTPFEIGKLESGTQANATITEEDGKKLLNITFPPAGKGEDGSPGKSAYDLWLELGNNGTEQEFLDYLKGIDGVDGKDGVPGRDGADGPKGDSAYQTWLSLGNVGSEEDFINSMRGNKGDSGKGTYVSTVAINDGSTIARSDVIAGTSITIGDTIIDPYGNVYSVVSFTGTTITVGQVLFSIKGEQGPQGPAAPETDKSKFITFGE